MAFAVGHMLLMPAEHSRILAPFALGTAVFLLGASYYGRSLRLPLRLVNPVAFALVLTVCSNVFLHMAVTSDPAQALNGLLIMIGASSLILARGWLAAVMVCLIPIYVLTGSMLPDGSSAHWWFGFMSSAVLGWIIQSAIRRLIVKHADLAHRDQQQRSELKEALREAESLKDSLEVAMRGANDGIWEWQLASNKLSVSARWNHIVGLPHQPERHIEEWADRVHTSDRERVEHAVRAHIQGLTAHLEISYRMQIVPEQYRVVLMRGLADRGANGEAIRLAGSLTDFSNTETHDPHTGLPGRTVLIERTNRAIERWRRAQHGFAIFQVDLAGLSEIGESLSTVAKDQFLIASAERLENQLRATDLVSRPSALSRTGRDQFTMLIEGVSSRREVSEVELRVRRLFDEPFKVDGNWAKAELRLGVALAGDGTAEDYLRQAGMAATHARKTGQKSVVFDSELETGAQHTVLIESELRQAIERGELCVHYQPVLDLVTSTIDSVEALVRWEHPQRGLVSPVEFIPIAERSDLIVDLDLHVLEEACRQASDWTRAGQDLRLHVNVSARTYLSDRFPVRLEKVFGQSLFDASNLVVELTESLVMESGGRTDQRLKELRKLGVRVALDDFGTGYSSLARLDQFQLDILKIDRAFLKGAPGTQSWRLVRTIVSLGQHFGLVVVAEGVEAEEQVSALREAGCTLAQGFLFSKPLPSLEMGVLLRSKEPLMARSSSTQGHSKLTH